MSPLLRRVAPAAVEPARQDVLDAETLAVARTIVDDVRARGAAAVREHAERLGDLAPGAPLVLDAAALAAASASVGEAEHALLERTARRIRRFAEAQRLTLRELQVDVPGGRAGHQVVPLEGAGCYAPGGRFPLPSSVLMTAVTARAAGVARVWVASPRPTALTLAAAAIAGADGVLCAGGAQAIAALAYGADPVPASDIVAGPGNRFVTAAKRLVSGDVRIDLLAGPSELTVLADETAEAGLVAADLLAQAEHDPDARAVLVTTHPPLVAAVEAELERQLADLPTASTARAALEGQGLAVVAADLEQALQIVDRLAPEHLEVLVRDAPSLRTRFRHFGGLFLGAASAEVLGDYGAGPNHVLPTGGAARLTGGLSVFDFLRVRTWMLLDPGATTELARDAVALARVEGLEAHARSAERRL